MSDSDSDWGPEKEIVYSDGELEDARQQWAGIQYEGLINIVDRWRHHTNGAPDIIDLETESIVQNNGHLRSLPIAVNDTFRGYGPSKGRNGGQHGDSEDESDGGGDPEASVAPSSTATDPLVAITRNRCELLGEIIRLLR